jgi:hypothetical protein
MAMYTAGAERFRLGTAGQFGIAGANYGTAGQVLTSGGPSAAPTWSAVPAPSDMVTLSTTQTITGAKTFDNNVTISGTGRRIRGGFDVSGGTATSRTMFQSSQTNSLTSVGFLPSGTGVGAYFQGFALSDPDNSPYAGFSCDAGSVVFAAEKTGTAAYPELGFRSGGAVALKIPNTGQVLATLPAGMGYGPGAGGTVTQATSKTTAVTLNKPCGTIVTTADSIDPNSQVVFLFNNSTIGYNDTVSLDLAETGAGAEWYWFSKLVGVGHVYIVIHNATGVAQAQALTINFQVHKGSAS